MTPPPPPPERQKFTQMTKRPEGSPKRPNTRSQTNKAKENQLWWINEDTGNEIANLKEKLSTAQTELERVCLQAQIDLWNQFNALRTLWADSEGPTQLGYQFSLSCFKKYVTNYDTYNMADMVDDIREQGQMVFEVDLRKADIVASFDLQKYDLYDETCNLEKLGDTVQAVQTFLEDIGPIGDETTSLYNGVVEQSVETEEVSKLSFGNFYTPSEVKTIKKAQMIQTKLSQLEGLLRDLQNYLVETEKIPFDSAESLVEGTSPSMNLTPAGNSFLTLLLNELKNKMLNPDATQPKPVGEGIKQLLTYIWSDGTLESFKKKFMNNLNVVTDNDKSLWKNILTLKKSIGVWDFEWIQCFKEKRFDAIVQVLKKLHDMCPTPETCTFKTQPGLEFLLNAADYIAKLQT